MFLLSVILHPYYGRSHFNSYLRKVMSRPFSINKPFYLLLFMSKLFLIVIIIYFNETNFNIQGPDSYTR